MNLLEQLAVPEELNKFSFCGDHSSLASLILNTDVSTGCRLFGIALLKWED